MKRQCGSDAFLVITSVEGTYLSDLDAESDAVAESQSKMWENVVWRSRGFGGGLSQAEGYGSCAVCRCRVETLLSGG